MLQAAQQQLDAGKDLSSATWLSIQNGKAHAVDFTAYAQAAGRQKTPPAFDDVNLSAGENQLFGTSSIDKQHFTAFSQTHNTAQGATLAAPHIVRLMNPMHFIGQRQTHTAQYWRIRHGTNDRDTSLAIPTVLALKLQKHGKKVDFALPWGQGHGGDYDLEELFTWAKNITQNSPK